MIFSMRTKLTGSFIIIALFFFASASILANFVFEREFTQFTIRQNQSKIAQVQDLISQAFHEDGSLSPDAIEQIGILALEEGLIIRLIDGQGAVLWDARVHNDGMCAAILSNMATNMSSFRSDFKGAYEEKTYAIVAYGKNLGQLVVGYYGPYYFTEHEVLLISSVNKLLILSASISLFIAVLMGILMAKRISKPLTEITEQAQKMSRGNYDASRLTSSSTREIHDLSLSIAKASQFLRDQEMLRKRLTSDLTHEFRTPLTSLRSQLEMVQEGIWEADKSRLKSIIEDVDRVDGLVLDFEKLGKSERDAFELERSHFQLQDLIEECARGFESLAAAKSIEIHQQLQSFMIYGDRDQLHQVIGNLISNSIKYGRENGVTLIQLIAENGWAVIRVKDNGIGISKDDLPHVFERFYRGDQSRNSAVPGSGIGLTIVKNLVTAHGGSITADSTLDEGSCFTVSLPIDNSKA